MIWKGGRAIKKVMSLTQILLFTFFWLNLSFLVSHEALIMLSKKVVLFPEIGRVKFFISLTRPHSRMCIKIYIFNKKTTTIEKVKETKEVKRISVENVTEYDGIVCEFALCTFNFLIKSWISPGCYMNLKWFRCNARNIAFLLLQQQMKYTFKNKNKI